MNLTLISSVYSICFVFFILFNLVHLLLQIRDSLAVKRNAVHREDQGEHGSEIAPTIMLCPPFSGYRKGDPFVKNS